ncbi:hypothetical protein [Streptomyces sp. NPDC008121]|uniref:hypothetical protein n=1 Tax=Streptomyces sp. NPDC008121 TaxID=3364809 RepID=UPI0036EFCBCA
MPPSPAAPRDHPHRSGHHTSASLYQQRAAYVWNNDRDTATLKRSNATKADTCSYNSTRVDSIMC